MTTPKVSIIIPAYNAARYIKEAVDSALAQTYPSVEVVVIDDGSTDDTKRILEPYIGAGKIKYVYQTNKGLAGARNTGIKNSSGEFIAFLDADDLFLPEKVAAQARVLEENRGYGVCYSDLTHFTDTNPPTFFRHRYSYSSGNVFRELLKKQFINPLTVMARRSLFDEYGCFDEALRRSEDWDLWLRWAHAGVRFYYLPKVLAQYRIRSAGNLSAIESEPEMKEKNFEVFRRLGNRLSATEWRAYNFSGILRRLKLKCAIAYLMVGKKLDALRFSDAMPLGAVTLVEIIPAEWWKRFLGAVRGIKHRMLLKRVE